MMHLRTVFLVLLCFMSTRLQAQEADGEPGSPTATKTIDGVYLPSLPESFRGEISSNAADSTTYWPARIVPPKGAPNILLIITDDVGYGAPSTFGGGIPTPALDRVAQDGLRYTQFHSTALCSPTRAALITGRNHHSVGFGIVSELSTGYPGYNSLIKKETATIAQILRAHGYATAWFGKDHNVPAFHTSQVGSFDQWPCGMGFDYFYGFIGGDTNQWQPNLFRNTTPIYPYIGKPEWNLTTAMADEAILWMKQLKAIVPDKPFLLYYAPGGTHAPHHPTREWVDKFKGQFDAGWNQYREETFERQKSLGVIPPDATLTPWPDDLLKEWDALTPDEKKMFARQAEVYAAFLAYTDYEIGRVIQAIDDLGEIDNTLIIYISGDNGSSPEGTPIGTPNVIASFNSVEVSVSDQLEKYYDIWGTDQTYPHMAVGWTWAFNTPFKWTKQVASFFGGTRQGVAIAWPKRIKDAGGIRTQFHHVVDIVPTILEVTGIRAPDMVDGVVQKPIEGVSMVYTFDRRNAQEPSKHRTQYFEMLGHRAIYQEGWIASTVPNHAPWEFIKDPNPDVMNAYKWELYNLKDDWTQDNDLAERFPEKLRELQELFIVEGTKYQVFPLDNTHSGRLLQPRPGHAIERSVFTYDGEIFGIPYGDAPSILNTSFTIIADVEIPYGGAEGMLVTEGGRFGGYGLYLLKGKPVFAYNRLGFDITRWEGAEEISWGHHIILFDFIYDGGGLGKGGEGVLKVDGKIVARQRIEQTTPYTFQWDETFDVGVDTGTSVEDRDYQVPFRFTGTLNRLRLFLKPLDLSEEEHNIFLQKGERNNSSSE